MSELDTAWEAVERAVTADEIRSALARYRELAPGIVVLPSIAQRCTLMADDRLHGRL